MAIEDSAKKDQESGKGEGTGWAALREQIRRARSSVPPIGQAGPTPEPSGVRMRPPQQQRWSSPSPRVFGKTVPPVVQSTTEIVTESSIAPQATIPDRPPIASKAVPTASENTAQSASTPATTAEVAVVSSTGDDAQRFGRSRSATPRERRITVSDRRRPRRFETKMGYGVHPGTDTDENLSQSAPPPQAATSGRSDLVAPVRSNADRSRADTPRQRIIPRVARRAPEEGDNTPVGSRAAALRRASTPPPAAGVKAVKKVIDERVALPSVVVDPSLSQDAVPSNVALRSDSDGQMLPSIVVDPTLEAVMAARELPTAESIATSRSGARWDSRGVAVKALLALAAVLLLGAALSRLG